MKFDMSLDAENRPETFDYEDKDESVVYPPDPQIVRRGRDAVDD